MRKAGYFKKKFCSQLSGTLLPSGNLCAEIIIQNTVAAMPRYILN
jgi:hypothetical protein